MPMLPTIDMKSGECTPLVVAPIQPFLAKGITLQPPIIPLANRYDDNEEFSILVF